MPPTDRFLNVSVSADRPDYKPGDMATFHLKRHRRARPAGAHRGEPGDRRRARCTTSSRTSRPTRACTSTASAAAQEIGQGWSLGQDLGQTQDTSRKRESYKQHGFVVAGGHGAVARTGRRTCCRVHAVRRSGDPPPRREQHRLRRRHADGAHSVERRAGPGHARWAWAVAMPRRAAGGGRGGGGMRMAGQAPMQPEQMVQLPPVSLGGPLGGGAGPHALRGHRLLESLRHHRTTMAPRQ